MPDLPGIHIRLTVTGDCGHVLGTWTDRIEEKYPFYCMECGDECREGKYPWTITAQGVDAGGDAGGLADVMRAIYTEGIRYGEMDEAGRTAYREENARLLAELEALADEPLKAQRVRVTVAGQPVACECGHPRRCHWEHSEPGGPRKGCGILGCECTAYAG